MKSYRVGITGSFGTGKSLVGNILKRLGYFVVDTDDIVADLLARKNDLTVRVAKEFGTTNKGELGNIIFNNARKRKKLEYIIHPQVKKRVQKLVSSNSRKKIIFVLVPLLFESNFESFFNEIWCVICNLKTQLKRLKEKGFLKSAAQKRINAQFSQDKKQKKSDFIIDNSSTKEKTKKQVLNRLKQLAQLNHIPHCFAYKGY